MVAPQQIPTKRNLSIPLHGHQDKKYFSPKVWTKESMFAQGKQNKRGACFLSLEQSAQDKP